MTGARVKDEAWMEHVSRVLKQEKLGEDDTVMWSGYNSKLSSDDTVKSPAETGIYPLFPEKAASASSMKHIMELTMKGSEFLNPGRTVPMQNIPDFRG